MPFSITIRQAKGKTRLFQTLEPASYILLDGFDDLFFGVTFFHFEISIGSRLLEISLMSWFKFGGKVSGYPIFLLTRLKKDTHKL